MRAALDQENPRVTGIDVAELMLQGVHRQLADLSGDLHTCRTGSHNHEGQQLLDLLWIVLHLGLLKRGKYPRTQF